MGLYTNKGLYNTYDKNHKERDKTDYYATPANEVKNILDTLHIDFSNQTILEPCCGGGHMAMGIIDYLVENNQIDSTTLIATDLHLHPQKINDDYITKYNPQFGEEYDYLSDDYPYEPKSVDWIIMNPPYATIEPFVIRSLEIARKGIVMLGRLQFLEGEKRYNSILSTNPPTDTYVYADRIQCWKGGVEPEGSSAQAYAWFIWDFSHSNNTPRLRWIRRVGK